MGVAGGYLLGRTRKLRLALALGGVLAGRKLASQGQGLQGLMGQGSKLLENNPQLKELQNQVTGHLVEVAREAALVTAASRIEALTKSLQAKQQAGEQEGGEAGIESAVGGVTHSLGLKRSDEGQPEGESEEQEQPQGRAGEQEPEEESGEEESGEPQDQTAEAEPDEEESSEEESGEGQPRGRADEQQSGVEESGEEESQEQPGRRDRVRGRLRRRRPEGGGSGGSASDDEATPRDVAKKVSAKKASKPVAAKSGDRS